MNTTLFVNAIGLLGPGMPDWNSSLRFLKGEDDLSLDPVIFPKPSLLPPNEARRTTRLIKLVLNVCEQLCSQTDAIYLKVPTIFSSPGIDYDILDTICRTLNTNPENVSPSLFHNSVHNAPAGYWSISLDSHSPYISISASKYSFAMGILEAIASLENYNKTIVLTTFEMFTSLTLHKIVPIDYPFAVSMLLSAKQTKDSIAKLTIQLTNEGPESVGISETFEILRLNNGAARCLPLLCSIASLSLNTSNKSQESISTFSLINQYLTIKSEVV